MTSRTTTSPSGRFRSRAVLVTLVAAVTTVAAACTPPPPPPTTWTPGVCPDDSGVTVVVDFAMAGDDVLVRCAVGPQDSGLDALGAIDLAVTEVPGVPGAICTIGGVPAEGYPACWLTDGYWSYWSAAAQGDDWGFSPLGPADGPIAEGSVLGWAWAPGFVSDGPRVGSDGV